jgi:hypothetical protein
MLRWTKIKVELRASEVGARQNRVLEICAGQVCAA